VEPAVVVEGLSKRFGRIEALRDVSFTVAPGQTYGLLGPGGCGKTTLIRLLLGVLSPSAGRALALGRPVPSPVTAAAVGYMPQLPALYQELTARENVSFFASLYGVHSRVAVEETLALVELADRADSPISTFSGGMKQRASLACALVHRPRLLLLDEPTVGVDPRLRAAFWAYFHRLNDEGVTIILSSHVMDEADRCHRLILLRDGRLLAEGAPSELRSRAGASTLEEAFLAFAGDGT
jgi:ABC-2 type transport system ATP-binding protein